MFHVRLRLTQTPVAVIILTVFSEVAGAGKDLSPPSPDKPLLPPGLDGYETESARGNLRARRNVEPREIDPKKAYSLAKLAGIT
jgi:hypothetical protein